jgi:hypothetical protein
MSWRGPPSVALVAVCLAAASFGGVARPEVAPSAGASRPAASAAPRTVPAGDTARTTPPGFEVVYPGERVPLRFDHRRHVRGIGLSCVYCHTNAATSRRTADRLSAPPERCDACHGTDHEQSGNVAAGFGPAADCGYCHDGHSVVDGNRVARVVSPPANLVFDHAAHHARGIRCAECHGAVADEALASRADLPTMQTCLRCHGSPPAKAPGACDVCHVTREGARIETSFPEGELRPPAWLHGAEHGPDWVFRHRLVAAADSEFCASCHSEKECVDCHDGRVRPRAVHPNDWLSLHPTAARQNDPNCSSCHRAQSFCITCHERSGITMSGPLAALDGQGRFHPPRSVWTDPPRTPRHHAWEAERNISACVSCHTERDCAECHATAARGGRGGLDPHPVGFEASCRNAFSKNARPCLFCHDVSDPTLARCR